MLNKMLEDKIDGIMRKTIKTKLLKRVYAFFRIKY